MDIHALANVQKGGYYLFIWGSHCHENLVSYFTEQKEQKGQEKDLECWWGE